MKLKKKYDLSAFMLADGEGAERIDRDAVNVAVARGTELKVTHVEIQHLSETWKPSEKVVNRGVKEGWIVLGAGKLSLVVSETGDTKDFKIVGNPGLYCCHDGKEQRNQAEARRYIAKNFPDTPSPDPMNPAGYARRHCYVVEAA